MDGCTGICVTFVHPPCCRCQLHTPNGSSFVREDDGVCDKLRALPAPTRRTWLSFHAAAAGTWSLEMDAIHGSTRLVAAVIVGCVRMPCSQSLYTDADATTNTFK